MGDHWVHLYRNESALLDRAASFLGTGLGSGGTVVVIATPTHRSELGPRLAPLAQPGNYISLDAGETLAAFMVDGMPDPARFDAVVGAVVREAAAKGPLRAFGEMVGLLVVQGNPEAAMELEKLWNGLGQATELELMCGYPTWCLENAPGLAEHVCELHAGVLEADEVDHQRRVADLEADLDSFATTLESSPVHDEARRHVAAAKEALGHLKGAVTRPDHVIRRSARRPEPLLHAT